MKEKEKRKKMEIRGGVQDIIEIYNMLEDEQSKEIYLNRLNWLISGNVKYIDDIVASYMPWLPPHRVNILRHAAEIRDSLPKDRKFVLYGAGAIGKEVLPIYRTDRRLIGFCSQAKAQQENGYLGYPVMSPEELLARKDLSVVISTINAFEEIRQILKAGGYPEDQIYGGFEYTWCAGFGQYFAPDFIVFEDEEVFIDAGCFDLETSLEMRKRCRHLKKVYALEPDPDNYEICLEKKLQHEFNEVELLAAGAWSERTVLCFDATNSGHSRIDGDGTTSISAVPIDEIVDSSDKVTMIKLDIEGAELEALKGARETILRHKPKLAICIYHKPEDMIDIPLYIKELVPEYKLYVRHYTNTNDETVLYAVMP